MSADGTASRTSKFEDSNTLKGEVKSHDAEGRTVLLAPPRFGRPCSTSQVINRKGEEPHQLMKRCSLVERGAVSLFGRS